MPHYCNLKPRSPQSLSFHDEMRIASKFILILVGLFSLHFFSTGQQISCVYIYVVSTSIIHAYMSKIHLVSKMSI